MPRPSNTYGDRGFSFPKKLYDRPRCADCSPRFRTAARAVRIALRGSGQPPALRGLLSEVPDSRPRCADLLSEVPDSRPHCADLLSEVPDSRPR